MTVKKTPPPEYPTVEWTGDNMAEVEQFCGSDPLGSPAANFGRAWHGDHEVTTLRVYNTPHRTMYPVEAGELIVNGPDGLRPVDSDTSSYERRHEGEDRGR